MNENIVNKQINGFEIKSSNLEILENSVNHNDDSASTLKLLNQNNSL